MKHLSPVLFTKDLSATIEFYSTVLGFSSRSAFPNFASLYRDEIEIMMVVPREPADSGSKEFFTKPCFTGNLYIMLDNVDELWESLKDKVTVIASIADREYLMRDFSIADNNGYELVFGKDIS